nr:hypothetical protein BaRGS_017354 [Batillaria attramentaria]
MLVTKPRKFGIRRSFENGIWVQYKTSPHQLQLHAKINRIQLDNQLSHAVFPTVLSPLPPPKSVAAESVPKPFTEVSVMMRKHEHSNVQQIKYFKVLIQEMRVSVDQGFLNAILQLFAANEPLPREQETIQFKEDVGKTEKTLIDVAGLSLAEEQKNFYDYLHFSPIKVHLSFSLQTGTGSSDGKPTEIQAGVINVFLQSVGVVLTDVQDVVFKLGYFERSHAFYNQSQLTGEMTQHYAGQAIKQMYVLVLGLDVLGNPFGLLRGLSEGIEDLFYEPYQGAIQGPEEFAEGLALGVRSLFGHAVGGAAGAVSRITGTVGKGLAALTLDDDYQKKRREQLNKRPANAREGFARGGKGLVMGVFDGVTGIVRKPVEGAKQEGVSGFFKGVGKGLVGVVTRPTSGVIDFASSSFEGIRRIAEVQDEIRRLRPPRRFFKDKVIRPYNHQEAEGRLVMAKRGEIFGAWDCEWTYVWSELKEPPKKIAKGVEIILKEKEKKKFFSSSATKKDVIIIDPKLSEVTTGGVEPAIRRDVWRFLFGLYPCNSTAREREATLLDNIVKYHELKSRWKTLLVLSSQPGQTPLQQGLIARYQMPQEAPPVSPDLSSQEPMMERAMDAINSQAVSVQTGSIDFAGMGHADLAAEYSAPEMQQRLDFMQLQARVYVNRKRVDINQLRSYIRVIDKDVPRTDRDVEYFQGHANPHLTQLRDILVTFAAYNHQLGYAQGMNDILARFLFVLGSEVETFWCFQHYMDRVQNDFMEEGMVYKIELELSQTGISQELSQTGISQELSQTGISQELSQTGISQELSQTGIIFTDLSDDL